MLAAIANALIYVGGFVLVLLLMYIIARVISRAATKSWLETTEEHRIEQIDRAAKKILEQFSKESSNGK